MTATNGDDNKSDDNNNSGSDGGAIMSRVEVNQRALIDKILARYASANAVYRELLQNSNDAESTHAEIYFYCSSKNDDNCNSSVVLDDPLSKKKIATTTTKKQNTSNLVTQMVYKNNGMAFRPQDWNRLQKIAEGNPDPSKVGAFGVGAYSMFSLSEAPMVLSGKQALCFVWRGDALWTKVMNLTKEQIESNQNWTTFSLPSRDPYPLPDMIEFGKFLCANLTFTQCLKTVTVYVDECKVLTITKTTLQEPSLVKVPKASSWWNNDGAITSTPLFNLQPIYDSQQQIQVTLVEKTLRGNSMTHTSRISARYVTAKAKTKIPPTVAKRMERVTKKAPPAHVTIQVVLGDASDDDDGQDNNNDEKKKRKKANNNGASEITASFSPQAGNGRVFIGFRTSQTTGLSAHLAAPLVPTVEREAIDLQDAALKPYNAQLLELCGMVLRLTLEHAMLVQINNAYLEGLPQRMA